MLTITKEPLAPEAYLAAERKSETKNEYINGQIIPMINASLAHNIIANKIAALLTFQLEDKDFTICQSDMRVHNPLDESYFYPDVVVYAGEAQLIDNEFDNLLNPALIVEVLSPGTENYDRGEKSLFYRHIPSLKEYLIVSQDEAFAEHLVKIGENKWQLEEIRGMEKTIPLLGNACELKMTEVYKKVKLKK
jgi:Uma2 family endonuclease